MYAGPKLDPCTTLTEMLTVGDSMSRNLVQCLRPLKQFSRPIQLNISSGICGDDILSKSFWCLILSKVLPWRSRGQRLGHKIKHGADGKLEGDYTEQ